MSVAWCLGTLILVSDWIDPSFRFEATPLTEVELDTLDICELKLLPLSGQSFETGFLKSCP